MQSDARLGGLHGFSDLAASKFECLGAAFLGALTEASATVSTAAQALYQP